MTITLQSGYHYDGNMVDITFRYMNFDPFGGDPAVASSTVEILILYGCS